MKLIGILITAVLAAVVPAVAQPLTASQLDLAKKMNGDGFWVAVETNHKTQAGMLDTGASVTVLPLDMIPPGSVFTGVQPITTSDGTGSGHGKYLIDLTVDGCLLRNVEVVGLPGSPFVMLGIPLLRTLDANLHVLKDTATIVCPTTGATLTVSTPNAGPIKTSELTQ